MRFDAGERVADAVLYEGYVLYPYRASAMKNHCRWQFGVVAPRSLHDDGEPWYAQTECVVRVEGLQSPVGSLLPRVFVRVRFLQPRPTATGWLEGVTHA